MSDLVEDFMSEDPSTVLTGGMLCAVRAEVLQLRAQVDHWKRAYEDARDLAKLAITSTENRDV